VKWLYQEEVENHINTMKPDPAECQMHISPTPHWRHHRKLLAFIISTPVSNVLLSK
jgi:hypothetical protein